MKTMIDMRFSLMAMAMLLSALSAHAEPAPSVQTPWRQYTFSWKFLDESTLAPRGGSTQGTTVKLVTEPTPEWRALQAPGLAKFERDRRAILAMAGGYRSSFDFIEVASFKEGAFKPDRPYQSWGTEKVYVLQDKGDSIMLQHLLVMTMASENGQVEGPFVIKHWRQDWQYEPKDQLVYRGGNTWERIAVPSAQSTGQWRQTVYQVDDSPRYSGVAAWQHLANYSSWGDDDGWRPLPRREYSVRQDYQVLIGSNRHTITPTGWLHEQQNLKVALDASNQLAGATPVIARELGFNRYERISDYDWRAGDRYIQASEPVWSAVRQKWDQLIARQEPLRLRGAPDKDQLFAPLYDYAESVAAPGAQPKTAQEIKQHVDQAVESYLLKTPAAPGGQRPWLRHDRH